MDIPILEILSLVMVVSGMVAIPVVQ